jgi:hypothetical protein
VAELLRSGQASPFCYLVFKACEYALAQVRSKEPYGDFLPWMPLTAVRWPLALVARHRLSPLTVAR